MSRHRTVPTVPIVAAVVAAVTMWAAPAMAGGGTRWVRADFDAVTPAAEFDETSCDPSGRCLVSYTIGTGTLTGDVEGEITTYGTLYFDPVAVRYTGTSYQLFTGTVAGCGAGTLVMMLPSFSGGPQAPITANGSVVTGSGTGDLTGVRGKVRNVFTTLADGSGSTTGRIDLWCTRR